MYGTKRNFSHQRAPPNIIVKMRKKCVMDPLDLVNKYIKELDIDVGKNTILKDSQKLTCKIQ